MRIYFEANKMSENQRPKTEDRRPNAVYDRVASRYETMISPLERFGLTRWRKEALSLLPANSRILEIGAGTGLNFAHYPQGVCGVASELSFKMIEIARKKKEKPSGVQFVQSSAEKIPFADNSFDAAFATLVFCSVASPQDALAEMKRVVRTQGKIVLLDHVRPKGIFGPVFDVINFFTVRLFEDHFNRRTAEEARKAGLEIITAKQRALSIINIIECKVTK
jgi:ubiquinone/menaquinone biosynthesis C-methylase UbiE